MESPIKQLQTPQKLNRPVPNDVIAAEEKEFKKWWGQKYKEELDRFCAERSEIEHNKKKWELDHTKATLENERVSFEREKELQNQIREIQAVRMKESLDNQMKMRQDKQDTRAIEHAQIQAKMTRIFADEEKRAQMEREYRKVLGQELDYHTQVKREVS